MVDVAKLGVEPKPLYFVITQNSVLTILNFITVNQSLTNQGLKTLLMLYEEITRAIGGNRTRFACLSLINSRRRLWHRPHLKSLHGVKPVGINAVQMLTLNIL